MTISILFNVSVVFHLDNRTKALIHTCAPREARATFWFDARIHVVMTSKSVTVSLRFLRWAGGKAVDGKCLRSDGRARVGVACCDVGDDGRGLEHDIQHETPRHRRT